jgi:hypothetical protein
MNPEVFVGLQIMLTFFVLAYAVAKYTGRDAD